MMNKFILTLAFITTTCSLLATHNRAGEITYKRITPFSQVVGSTTVEVYNYEITVTLYTNDGPGIADRCSDTLYYGDGSKAVAYRSNGTTTGCTNSSCGSSVPCGDIIYSSPNYVVKKSVFVFHHTYPGPGTYVVYTYDPNRNQGVVNIPNSVNIPFYIESQIIIKAGSSANTSPVLSNPPIGFGYLNICYVHNPGAYDADGDSLAFQISPCLTPGGTTTPGYSYPSPGTFSINPSNGVLNWCSPQTLGEYNVAFIVQEWRKNNNNIYQLLGQVERDMQIKVVNGVVGLAENDLEGFRIFPNPAHDKIFLPDTFNTDFTIYSASGSAVLKTNPGNHEIDISQLAPGLYYIRGGNPVSGISVRFVKQ